MDSRVSVAENPAVYSPHLKKVLKSFQMTSMRSLSGPDTRPVYGMGYGLDKDLPSSPLLTAPYTTTLHSSSTKSNMISVDGVYYKKRPKSGLSLNGGHVKNNCSEVGVRGENDVNPSAKMGGDSNNNSNSNDTSTASANKNSKSNATEMSNGKSNAMVLVSTTATESGVGNGSGVELNEERFDNEVFLGPPPFPIQQVPILTAADQGWSESKTLLEGEMISCFVVGGEKRLCLPQILNTVLRDFSLPQINAVCDELQIYCSRCNQEQLSVLKVTGILPPSAPSCGLVTKTDCERLCNALLHRYPPRAVHNLPPEKRPFHFRIYHECFGKCEGVYTPDHFITPHAKCIECVECHGLLSPQKFVGHVHKALENRTCHWGFDSSSWRAYILVAKSQENMSHLRELLDEMKDRFDNTKNNRKRKPRTTATVIKAEAVEFDEENVQQSSSVVGGVADEGEDDLEVKEEAAGVIKKRKTEITDTYYPYVYDPVVACYYGFPPNPCHPHATNNPSALSRLSAFRPWSPLLTTKEGKYNLNMPPNTVAFLRESAPPPLPAYLSRGPPVLLNPERVVPISETERFERHYQPNVALAPPSAQQLQAKQKSQSSGSHNVVENGGSQRAIVRSKQAVSCSSKKLPDSVTVTATSNTAAPPPPPPPHRGYSDIELSTDTDETFSDSTTYSASGSPTSCSPRNLSKDGQSSSGGDVGAGLVSDMEFLRHLLEDEVTDQEVRDKVLRKVAHMCCTMEQKLKKSELSNRQLQQELEYVKMSKRERLREAAEAKRQLRKEVERIYEERISLERQLDEMRKNSLSLSSSLQRQIVLKREQTDEDEQEEVGTSTKDDVGGDCSDLDQLPNQAVVQDRVEEEEEDEVENEEQVMAEEEEEVADVKPNLGLLVASVSNGY